MKKTVQMLLAALLLGVFFESKAAAYLDPGVFTYVLQIIIAFVVGGVVTVRLFWKKIKNLFLKLISKKQ